MIDWSWIGLPRALGAWVGLHFAHSAKEATPINHFINSFFLDFVIDLASFASLTPFHFLSSAPLVCFRWFARLFRGLVALALPAPITHSKEEQLNQPNQTNTAVGAHSLIKNGSLSLFASLFISFSIRKGPQGKEKII